MLEEVKQTAEAFGGGVWGYVSAIIVGGLGLIRWMFNRLYASFESRLDRMEKSTSDAHVRIDAIQKGQSEIKEILSSMMTAEQVIKLYERQTDKIDKFAERMDTKQDKTASEISSIKDHLLNRPRNERHND